MNIKVFKDWELDELFVSILSIVYVLGIPSFYAIVQLLVVPMMRWVETMLRESHPVARTRQRRSCGTVLIECLESPAFVSAFICQRHERPRCDDSKAHVRHESTLVPYSLSVNFEQKWYRNQGQAQKR